jgi:hypothetical protein
MFSAPRKSHAGGAPAPICLACGLLLLLAAGPFASSASAQSAEEEKLRGALLGLHRDFPEALVKITPRLLSLQRQLVEQHRLQVAAVKEDESIGKPGVAEIGAALLPYMRELETLKIMEARNKSPSISEKEILKIRIEMRSRALSVFKELRAEVEASVKAGEAGKGELAAARAAVLKAEIVLEAMKAAAE